MIKPKHILHTLLSFIILTRLGSCSEHGENDSLIIDCENNYAIRFENSCTYEGDLYTILEQKPELTITDNEFVQIINDEVGHLLPTNETGCIIYIKILIRKDNSSCVEKVKDNFTTEINYEGLSNSLSNDALWISGKRSGASENLSVWINLYINEGQIIDIWGI